MADKQQPLVSNIVYLTSLVSDIQQIDPWLDDLRMITSQSSTSGTQLSPKDEQTLLDLQARLKDYLAHKDPFRRIDPDILEQKMYENLQGSRRFRQLRMSVGIIIGLAVSSAIGVALLGRLGGMVLLPQLPYLTGFGVLCLGAVFLIAQAARTFNQQLREVYYLLCAAVVLVAVLTIQFAFYGVLGDSWWMKTWAFTALYAGIGTFFYLMFRTLAIQLQVNSIFLRKKTVVAIIVATAGISLVLPHATTELPELVYRLSIFGLLLLLAFSVSSILLGRKVIHNVSVLYAKAIWCLIIAAAAGAVDGCNLLAIRLVWLSTSHAPMLFSVGSMLLAATVGGLLLYASYVFNKTSRY